ncbi:hypothetical protein RFI_37923 [Reticulomyxa filosa]|uniref:Uncharacterized protein n=1 Tax=Reticulomyxa filosa TaxID=46433 RepID=X6LDC2_RETFI|nr:hypothetical protein RFI_37923 [Reticulomyxa filosa]|eukprot:ETN99548.1 hypothetical protein RFI_37923 [Reticulomyxa filosa]
MHCKTVEASDNVGVNLKKEICHTGDMMCIDDPTLDPNPPKQVIKCGDLVFVQDHPGQLKATANDGKDSYKGEFTPSIHIRTAKAHLSNIGNQMENKQSNKRCKN